MILFLKKEKKIHNLENNYSNNFRTNIYYIQEINTLKYFDLELYIFYCKILKYILFYYIFVYIFNLGVEPWSVPLQVVVV